MNPDKLTITNWETFEDIEVLFNPERYTLNKGVHIAEINIPGLDSPVLQFVRGLNEKITMELFFDTTKHGMLDSVKDVRGETRPMLHHVAGSFGVTNFSPSARRCPQIVCWKA
jgi:hypothetical protein